MKTDDPSWEQQQKTKETLREIDEQISSFQKLNEKLSALNSQSQKHELFSEAITEKFDDLQKLIEEIFPPEMFDDIDDIRAVSYTHLTLPTIYSV